MLNTLDSGTMKFLNPPEDIRTSRSLPSTATTVPLSCSDLTLDSPLICSDVVFGMACCAIAIADAAVKTIAVEHSPVSILPILAVIAFSPCFQFGWFALMQNVYESAGCRFAA